MPNLATTLKHKKESMRKPPSHLIIEALAGTGKTTTLVEGLKVMKGMEPSIHPSIQQLAIWEELEKSKDANSVCFVAFNKSIADELKRRVPAGCEAMTMHSMGLRAIRQAFDIPQTGIGEKWRIIDIIANLLHKDVRDLRRNEFQLLNATEKLVGLCKMTLAPVMSSTEGDEYDILDHLTSYYEIDLNGEREQVFDLVPQVLQKCMDVKHDNRIDFNDMIWLPIALNLPIQKYDLLLIDESQDLNRCQQALARKVGRRLVLCGDSHQAIYGFAGADSESMARMRLELQTTPEGCRVLPLTVTRRCGKGIVGEAKKVVPQFEAHESNHAGFITYQRYDDKSQLDDQKSYHNVVASGDMIICRVTAPLVSQCFKFLKQERKAEIIGRDIGTGLINLIKKFKADSIVDLVSKLSDWRAKEVANENAKRFPNEAKVISINDKYECLVCFTEGRETVQEVIQKIETVFTDNGDVEAIRLSTIHKAKGLEAKRVFFLMPEGGKCPHPMAKSEWQRNQEMNLLYVGITRAKEELVYVS